MVDQKYSVHLDNFDGPLDLLLHLIDKNKLDIYDIPIASVTEQYMAFLAEAQQLDLEIASEFLLIAATLINIKAKMLLPKKKSEETAEVDPRDELVSRLLEYKFYKEAAAILKDSAERSGEYYLREIDVNALAKDFTPANPVANVTLNHLLDAFQKVILHVSEEPPILTVAREEYYVEAYMSMILETVSAQQGLAFTDLFAPTDSRRKIITIFLALLELYKTNQIVCRQNGNFADIWIFDRPLDDDREVLVNVI